MNFAFCRNGVKNPDFVSKPFEACEYSRTLAVKMLKSVLGDGGEIPNHNY